MSNERVTMQPHVQLQLHNTHRYILHVFAIEGCRPLPAAVSRVANPITATVCMFMWATAILRLDRVVLVGVHIVLRHGLGGLEDDTVRALVVKVIANIVDILLAFVRDLVEVVDVSLGGANEILHTLQHRLVPSHAFFDGCMYLLCPH